MPKNSKDKAERTRPEGSARNASGRGVSENGQEFKVIKGKKQRNKRLALLRAGIGAAAVTAVIAFVVYASAKSPGGIVEWTQTAWAASGTGDGFPQTVAERNIRSIHTQDKCTAVFTDTCLAFYNKNGRHIRTALHGYTSPAICASGTRILVYDRGAMTFKVDNVHKTLYEKKTDSVITTAGMAEDGTFALAMESDSYPAQIKVFSKDFIEKSTRYISDGDVTAVFVCRGGKYIIAVTVTADEGYYRSTVSKYDMKSDEAVSSVSFDGVLIFSVRQTGSGNIFLVGNTKLICISEDLETRQETTYGGSRLAGYSVNEYGAALIFEQSDFNSEIAAFSETGAEVMRRQCDFSVSAAMRMKNCTYTVRSGCAECFDDAGNIINRYDTVGDAAYLAEGSGGRIAAASASELDMIAVK